MMLLFLIMRCTPTIRELIAATPLSLSSQRLPASRLLLPRSGLERSDFVLWHFSDMLGQASEVRCRGMNGPSSDGTEGPLITLSGLRLRPPRMPAPLASRAVCVLEPKQFLA